MAPTPFLAPSLVALRRQINALWPDRSTASDGWIGDPAHAARISDHNPDARGCVHAIDVTAEGILPAKLLSLLKADPRERVRYIIWDRHIYERKKGWEKTTYTGSNPHTKHMHISIEHARAIETDESDWFSDLDMPMTHADALTLLNTKFARNLNGPNDNLVIDMQSFAEIVDQKLDVLTAKINRLTDLVDKVAGAPSKP